LKLPRLFTLFGITVLGVTACSRSPESQVTTPPEPALRPGFLQPHAIGAAATGHPWITHLAIVDLDRDGRPDVVACEGRLNQVCWVRQTAKNVFVETVIGQPVQAPVHVDAVDFDGDGDLDLLIASMGVIFPNNQKIGAIVWMEQTAPGEFRNHTLAEKIERVTDVRAADLDRDGDLDLVVAQFGYDQGRVVWMENQGGGKFANHQLLALAGAIHAPVADFDGDGWPSVVTVVSQEWEEIHLFQNQRNRTFAPRVLYGSSNEDYGSSWLSLADVDRDGDWDILYSNGDAFDHARPGPRPWHGVQWLENTGRGKFVFHRLGNFPGAYSPIAIDLDGDGDQDIVAVSGFNHWEKTDAVSLLCFENDGRQRFTARPLAHLPTHLIVVAAADMDGDGAVELVTGSFHAYAPHERIARLTLWQR
jgi:hypothetical protein